MCLLMFHHLFICVCFSDALKLGYVTWNFMIKACREQNMDARNLSRLPLGFYPGIRLRM